MRGMCHLNALRPVARQPGRWQAVTHQAQRGVELRGGPALCHPGLVSAHCIHDSTHRCQSLRTPMVRFDAHLAGGGSALAAGQNLQRGLGGLQGVPRPACTGAAGEACGEAQVKLLLAGAYDTESSPRA